MKWNPLRSSSPHQGSSYFPISWGGEGGTFWDFPPKKRKTPPPPVDVILPLFKKLGEVGPIGPTKTKNKNAFSFFIFGPPPSNREVKNDQKRERVFVSDSDLSLQLVEQKPKMRNQP